MDDRVVVEQVLKGNLDAYQQIVDANTGLVGHMVFRMISNPTDRQDICQDVFVKAYENLKSFKFDCKLSTWIAKIAYNTCLNFQQKKRTPLYMEVKRPGDSEGVATGDENYDQSYWGSHSGLDIDLVRRESSRILAAEIDQLPDHYKAIVTLYHSDELSYDEIGKVLDMPAGTVKSHLFRARKLLKDRLLKQYTAEELSL